MLRQPERARRVDTRMGGVLATSLSKIPFHIARRLGQYGLLYMPIDLSIGWGIAY